MFSILLPYGISLGVIIMLYLLTFLWDSQKVDELIEAIGDIKGEMNLADPFNSLVMKI